MIELLDEKELSDKNDEELSISNTNIGRDKLTSCIFASNIQTCDFIGKEYLACDCVKFNNRCLDFDCHLCEFYT